MNKNPNPHTDSISKASPIKIPGINGNGNDGIIKLTANPSKLISDGSCVRLLC